MTKPHRETENYRLQRRIGKLASSRGAAQVRLRHPEEFERLYEEEKRSGKPLRNAHARASRTLANRYPEEYTLYRSVALVALEQEYGYTPAPRGGYATGRHAAARVTLSDPTTTDDTDEDRP